MQNLESLVSGEETILERVTASSPIRKKGLGYLEKYGVDLNMFYMEKGVLCEQYHAEPSDRDVIWALFHKVIEAHMAANKPVPRMIYREMAMVEELNGRFAVNALRAGAELDLHDWKRHGITKVIVKATIDSCEACKNNDGRVLTIEEALTEGPVPNINCNRSLRKNGPPYCRCIYQPVID